MAILNIITLIISVFALILSIWAFTIDRKLKLQQIRQNEDEKIRRTSADMFCEILADNKTIRIINRGQSIARNITFEYNEDQLPINGIHDVFPYKQLVHGEHLDFRFISEYAEDKHQRIVMTWDDDFQNGRRSEQVILIQ